MKRSFELTCDDVKLILNAIGFMPDYVHVAVSIPATVTLSGTVRRLKGASSNAVIKFGDRSETGQFSWQGECGALIFGDQALPFVVEYVNNQLQRHAE